MQCYKYICLLLLFFLGGCQGKDWKGWVYFSPTDLSKPVFIGKFVSENNCRKAARDYLSWRGFTQVRYICSYGCNVYGAECTDLIDSGIPPDNIKSYLEKSYSYLIEINNEYQKSFLTYWGRLRYRYLRFIFKTRPVSSEELKFMNSFDRFNFYTNKYNDLRMNNLLDLDSSPDEFKSVLDSHIKSTSLLLRDSTILGY